MQAYDQIFRQAMLNGKIRAKKAKSVKKTPLQRLKTPGPMRYNAGVRLNGSNVMDTAHTSSQTFQPRG